MAAKIPFTSITKKVNKKKGHNFTRQSLYDIVASFHAGT